MPSVPPGPQGSQSPNVPLRRLYRLSGRATAAVLLGCLALTAILIPAVFRLPPWVEYEIVLAVWWLIWLLALTKLLYTGMRVSHDFQMKQPRNWLGKSQPRQAISADRSKRSGGSWWDDFFTGWIIFDGEAAAIGCGIVIGIILLFGAIWFLIEVAIPLIAFLLYFMVRGMLAHVINDRHHCRGRIPQALLWGAVWATVYTVPLAGGVWAIHELYKKP